MIAVDFGLLVSDVLNIGSWIRSPVAWVLIGFQLWMFIDSIRRGEWMWAVFIFIFPVLNAVLYFFLVYQGSAAGSWRDFELSAWTAHRRIRELERKIKDLDHAEHYYELGSLLVRRKKLGRAEELLKVAVERDPSDLDYRGCLGRCLRQAGRWQEAILQLEPVIASDPKHGYGDSLMCYAECLSQVGRTEESIQAWQRLLQHYTYAQARVRLAELYRDKGQEAAARAELNQAIDEDQHGTRFQRKRERPWIWRAKRLRRQLKG